MTAKAIVAGKYRPRHAVKELPLAKESATVALVLAGIVVAPVVGFAILWTAFLLWIGAAWLLHLVGLA